MIKPFELIVMVCVCALVGQVEGRVYRVIDDFTDTPYNARFIPTVGEAYDYTAPYNWFSPYTNPADYVPGAPFSNFKNVPNVIGGQRDIIIAHFSNMQTQASVSCAVTQPASLEVSLPALFMGSIYLQYDGIDDTESPTSGARLGNNIGGDAGAGGNPDGTVDFTFSGQAKGIQISILIDSLMQYELKAVKLSDDTSVFGVGNTLEVTAATTGFNRFYFAYDDAGWSDPSFDWTQVAAFQLKIFTGAGSPIAQSSFSQIYLIQIATLQVEGTVRSDCDGLLPLSGIPVNIFNTLLSTTVPLHTTTTDANGDYAFVDLFTSSSGVIDSATPYRICLGDASLVGCPNAQPLSANGCYDFFITDAFDDLLHFDFTVSPSVGQVVIPADVTIHCSGDTTPDATGWATKDGVNLAYVDSTDGNACRLQIYRQWRDGEENEVGAQLITVNHALPPVITQHPASVTSYCDGTGREYNEFLNNAAGATVEEPCGGALFRSNDATSLPASQCFWSNTVVFTWANVCYETVQATATFILEDISPPFLVSPPVIHSTACSSSVNAEFQDWLATGSGASALSACTGTDGISFVNDWSGESVRCGRTYTVNFRTSNACGLQGIPFSSEFIIGASTFPPTRDTAQSITLPFEEQVNGHVNAEYQLPSEWEGRDIVDAVWYVLAPFARDTRIIASTCTTSIDSIIGIVVADGNNYVLAAANDDRVELSNGCDQLSSYVEFTVPANSPSVYVVVAAYIEGGNIDLRIYEAADTCEQLITHAQSEIISSLTLEISLASDAILTDNGALHSAMDQLNYDFHQAVEDLDGDFIDQFSQLQFNLAETRSALSTAITDSEYNVSGQVEELAGSVHNLADTVQSVSEGVSSTAGSVAALASHLNDVPSNLADVYDNLQNLANFQLPEVSSSVNWLRSTTDTHFVLLENLVNSRFDATDSSVAGVSAQTNSVLSNVAAVNTVVTQVKSYLETVNFERYLISSPTDVSNIPWQYRTPASYLGKMDDVLNFVMQTYNTKLTACVASTSPGCVWFRSNTAAPYSTLLSSYNSHVSNQRFKKAFDALQSFYLKMFPTTLFI